MWKDKRKEGREEESLKGRRGGKGSEQGGREEKRRAKGRYIPAP